MKGKAYMMALMMAAMAADSSILQSAVPVPTNGRVIRPVRKIIPKGCKEYFFNEDGSFVGKSSNHVFSCFALTDENAIKKYNKWIKNQQNGKEKARKEDQTEGNV
jgi:hypothetical protein